MRQVHLSHPSHRLHLSHLSHLSYHITYKTGSRRFSHQDLVDAYKKICETFQLPPGEANQVADELESHTGLIIYSGFEQYEFSHPSIQEYLCAYYLMRDPDCENMIEYLIEYLAPVAVATAMLLVAARRNLRTYSSK